LPSSAGRADTTVAASLLSARFSRTARGARRLTLIVNLDETVSADLRLLRGSRTLARKRYARLRSGRRNLTLDLAGKVASGAARLRLTFAEGNGNRKVIARSLKIPSR
jgi:hypothetical protein